ncbi:Auxin-responsive protein SAUR36 [Linum grandiflorum]
MQKWIKQLGVMASSSSWNSSTKGGHFVVYTVDKRRFVIPLKFLRRMVIVELLKMAEDEFGFSSDEPIVLPFEGYVMDQIIMFLSSDVHSAPQLLISPTGMHANC